MPTKDRRSGKLQLDSQQRPNAERRAHIRFPASLEVDYQSDDTYVYSFSADLSEMGIFVRTHAPYPAGTQLRLTFRVHGEQAIEAEGRVVWVADAKDEDAAAPMPAGPPGMGLEFVQLSASQRERILDLVRSFAYLGDGHPEG